MTKRFLLILAAMLVAAPLSSGFVRAAEPEAPVEPPLSYFETSRQALIKVLELSQTENNDLQLRLQALARPTDPELALVYDAIGDQLRSNEGLIASRIKEMNSSYLTLSGIQVTAYNFKNWREKVYDPATQEIFDFLILSQGNLVLTIADARYEKVAADVVKLKTSVGPKTAEALTTLLADANQRLIDARLLTEQARTLFLKAFRQAHKELSARFEQVDKRLAAENAALQASVIEGVLPSAPVVAPQQKTILDGLNLETETVQSLMQRAIDSLASAYKDFLQMRELVRGL